jgi:hypothetical protein
MKTIKIAVAMAAIAVGSLGMITHESSAERFASEIISSLQHASREQFGALFPTLNEFHELMERNREIYGENLEAAKQDFADEYNHRIAPAMIEAYESVQHSAAVAGIDWNNISVTRVAVDEGGDLEERSMTIYFSEDGEIHRLNIDGAFKLNGQWKAGIKMNLR